MAKFALARMPRESILDYGNLYSDENDDEGAVVPPFNDFGNPAVEDINQISCVTNNFNNLRPDKFSNS